MLPESIIVRDARCEDASTLARFNRDLAMETENLRLNLEVVLRGVGAVFENPQRGFYVVAEHQAAAKTLAAALLVTTEWSDWRCGELWWIQSVYVASPWRRRGIYRALYRYVQQRAQCHKTALGFRLYVARDNHAAQKTYTALGMRETPYKMFEHLNLR